ncbi:MAG: anaerobic ribonucleoside-triphosphate reductase activating protein [Bdellovibrionales bacterium]
MGQLYAITPFTQLDYPGELACIAWFSGCNLRCAYCHNPDIVLTHGDKSDEELLAFLDKRRGLLTGLVLSGGEATCCPAVPAIAQQAKEMGYKIKLDTNGTRPEIVRTMLESNLLDYVALDYKCPATQAQALLGTDKFVAAFRETLALLIAYAKGNDLTFETRTTFHPDLMDENDLNAILDDLERSDYHGTHYIQNVASWGESTLGNVRKPQRDIDREKLTAPRNFSLSFRKAS